MIRDQAGLLIINILPQAAEGERKAAEKVAELLQKQTAEEGEGSELEEPQKHTPWEEEPRMAIGAMHVPRETGGIP
jgi:hypothetical protein